MRFAWLTLLILISAPPFLLSPGAVHGGQVWWVDDDGPGDPGPGDPTHSDPEENGTPAHPYDAVQEAIDAAGPGDRIGLKSGLYKGVGNRDIDFRGKKITVVGVDGAGRCIIDAEGGGRGFIFQSGEKGRSKLAGVTIRNGIASHGGGISCIAGSSPRIVHCIITRNRAERRGGGIYCKESNPLIKNCRVTRNTVVHHYGRGGGLHCEYSRPNIVGTTISGNSVRTPSYGAPYGGGLCCWHSRPKITNCVITENEARYGGGIYSCHHSRPVVKDSTISGNEAGYGGGIYCLKNGTLSRCTLSGNTAGAGGGAYLRHGSNIKNCSITDNRAERSGGGIRCRDGEVVIRNCLIVNNSTAGEGGGIQAEAAAIIRVDSTILWGNRAVKGPQVGLRGAFDPDSWTAYEAILTFSYSNVEGGRERVHEGPHSCLRWQNGMISEDPRFLEPGADYHLSAESPCIDGGNPDYLPDPEETDIDGNPRVSQRRIDIGPDEYAHRGFIPDIMKEPHEK